MENGKDTVNKDVDAGSGGLFGLQRVGQPFRNGRCLKKVGGGERLIFKKIKIINKMSQFSSVQLLSHVQLFATP